AVGDDVGGDGLHVLADRGRLQQVLLNLLSNAVKYNRGGGRVAVRCADAPGHRVAIRITDTGPGIAHEHIERLFLPFERLGAEGRGVEGTGLGLALSKHLVDLMGGRVEVETELGVGGTVSAELPR